MGYEDDEIREINHNFIKNNMEPDKVSRTFTRMRQERKRESMPSVSGKCIIVKNTGGGMLTVLYSDGAPAVSSRMAIEDIITLTGNGTTVICVP